MTTQKNNRFAVLALLPFCLGSTISPVAGQELSYQQWKAALWHEVKQQGISAKLFQRAFKGVRPNYKLPRVRPHKEWQRLAARSKQQGDAKRSFIKRWNPNDLPASCRNPRQREFLFPTKYFPPKHLGRLINRGQSLLAKHRAVFKKIEQQYGVNIRAVLGIWGRETAYGQAQNRYSGMEVWASLAYAGPPDDREMHRQDLIAALHMLQGGHVALKNFKTSFAGATGYPQFTPHVFAQYAVDFDGDGRKNIWTSMPDAVASAANYLKGIGWQAGQGWGYEVKVPENFDCSLEGVPNRQPISAWQKLGVVRASSKVSKGLSFPRPDDKAQFMAPAGRLGPVFLVLENFEVFRRYNKADLYALFVGHLGDRIWCDKKGVKCGFTVPWPGKDRFGFSRPRICQIQSYLLHLGYSDEVPDGLFGGKTRRGIGHYQKLRGLKQTCFPSKKLLETLTRDVKSGRRAPYGISVYPQGK